LARTPRTCASAAHTAWLALPSEAGARTATTSASPSGPSQRPCTRSRLLPGLTRTVIRSGSLTRCRIRGPYPESAARTRVNGPQPPLLVPGHEIPTDNYTMYRAKMHAGQCTHLITDLLLPSGSSLGDFRCFTPGPVNGNGACLTYPKFIGRTPTMVSQAT